MNTSSFLLFWRVCLELFPGSVICGLLAKKCTGYTIFQPNWCHGSPSHESSMFFAIVLLFLPRIGPLDCHIRIPCAATTSAGVSAHFPGGDVDQAAKCTKFGKCCIQCVYIKGLPYFIQKTIFRIMYIYTYFSGIYIMCIYTLVYISIYLFIYYSIYVKRERARGVCIYISLIYIYIYLVFVYVCVYINTHVCIYIYPRCSYIRVCIYL